MSKEDKKPKLKKWSVTYRRTRIRVPYPRNPRKGICNACKRVRGKGIKVTQLHHTIYAFLLKTVKKNPLLALKYVLELCYPCHRVADGFRNILDATSLERMMMVATCLPDFQLQKLAKFCKKFLRWYNK